MHIHVEIFEHFFRLCTRLELLKSIANSDNPHCAAATNLFDLPREITSLE